MRPAHEGSAGFSATPIYDALYSEYRRSFRTLPGDRSGEEELTFRGFGTVTTGTGLGMTTAVAAGHRRHTGWSSAATSSAYALPPGSRSGL